MTSFEARLNQKVEALPRVTGGAEPGLSRRTLDMMRKAEDEAKALKDDFVSVEPDPRARARPTATSREPFEASGG